MKQKAENRGQLIDIARSYLNSNYVVCREDIPDLIDELISEVKILDIQRVSNNEVAFCASRDKCQHGEYCKHTDPDNCMDWEMR